ncbi:hypothetical protein ACFVR1_13775 [Psychrobacillus sp. NPDC058041]|uniref:hypothetical protein n=1 Tax=Psychrobacillus sp. NPDC058041 TaxID=3346310 RepID=UPI0036D9561F
MIWIKCIGLYLILVYLWTGFLWLIKIGLEKYKFKFLQRAESKQEIYLMNHDIKKMVNSIKFEMFLEDKINKVIPYFPYKSHRSYSDEQLMFAIRKNYDVFFFYIKRLLPFKFSSMIIIFLITRYYLNIDVLDYFSNLLTWKDIKTLGNPLPFITPSIALILLVVALYFTSRSGLFRKAKNKIKVEEIENKIKFHKQNRVILSKLVFGGYSNIEHMILKRKWIISMFKDVKGQEKPFDWLNNLEGIDELDKFMNELESKNKDLFPFFLGINHLSFLKLNNLYSEIFSQYKNRVSKLNGVFLTKSHMETVIKNSYYVAKFEENLNESILRSVKTLIYMEKYLDIINNQLNKPHSIYTFFAFIINKDK